MVIIVGAGRILSFAKWMEEMDGEFCSFEDGVDDLHRVELLRKVL